MHHEQQLPKPLGRASEARAWEGLGSPRLGGPPKPLLGRASEARAWEGLRSPIRQAEGWTVSRPTTAATMCRPDRSSRLPHFATKMAGYVGIPALCVDDLSATKCGTDFLKRKTLPLRARQRCSGSGTSDRECGPHNVVKLKSQRNEHSWTVLITLHAKGGQSRQALRTYEEMRKEGVQPSARTFVSVLKACGSLQDLESARRIHTELVKSGFESDLYVGTMLVDVYAKCRNLVDARYAFEKMPHRDVVSWNAMILGYVQMEKGEEALQLFKRMQQEGIVPHNRTYVSALKACSTIAQSGELKGVDGTMVKKWCVEAVRAIHTDILKAKSEFSVFVWTMLVNAYAKCESLEDARWVFEKMSLRDVVAWNTMILGYAQMDKGEEALQLYARMQREDVLPDCRTYVSALKACSTLAELRDKDKRGREMCLETVRSIHAEVRKRNFESDVFVGNMLVDAYAKCGRLKDSRHVFEKMHYRTVVSWTTMIYGYVQVDEGEEALHLYTRMQQEGVVPNDRTYVSALKACSSLAEVKGRNACEGRAVKESCLEMVRSIHSDIVKGKFESGVFVATMLVVAYAKCGSLEDGRHVFEKMPKRTAVSWNAMIIGYARMQKGDEALHLYTRMETEGVALDNQTFVSALKACTALAASDHANGCDKITVQKQSLEAVRAIHARMTKENLESAIFLWNMLVDAYAKCGNLEDSRQVFEKMPRRDVGSWNAMILGYAQLDKGEHALQLYSQMQQEGMLPDDRTYFSALKACSTIAQSGERDEVDDHITGKKRCLEAVRAIHADIVKRGCESGMFVGTMLMNVYMKCGSLEDARRVFEQIDCRDRVSWTAMISGYAQMDKGLEALQLYTRMQTEGVVPDDQTYVSVLKACRILAASDVSAGITVTKQCLETVRAIHAHVTKAGKFGTDVFWGNMLMDVYAKCGSLDDAMHVFENMPDRTVVSWNAMILGYAQMDKGEEALDLYRRMHQEGVVPDDRTYVSALKACSAMAELQDRNVRVGTAMKEMYLETVKGIHLDILKKKYDSDVFVGTMLVDAYAKCGSLEDAWHVFEKMPNHTVVSWTAVIFGFVQMDKVEIALQLYTQMQEEGVAPNDRTYVTALKACSRLAERDGRTPVKETCLETVKSIHRDILKGNVESGVFVGTMLVDAYAKCGSLEDARGVFNKMPDRTVVSWNAMILGYAQMDKGEDALQLYAKMQMEGVAPDERTYVGALNACASVAGLEKGMEIHVLILKAGMDAIDSFVRGGLIDMYGKCGSMVDARQVFDALPTRDIIAWNALIMGYAHQGESEHVFDLFHRMKQEGVQPDGITFLGVLTVCSHVGLLDTGQRYFKAMSRDYGITPRIEHFTCMVNLLGRSGKLDNAVEIVRAMPYQPDSAVWTCILGACRKWGDVKLGRQAFECAVRLNKDDAAAYVLMSNIYAAAHMREEAKEVQAMRVKSQAWKQPGRSRWTDANGILHVFVVGDQRHPESQAIYENLGYLFVRMKKEGYIPDPDSVLRDISDEEKAEDLCGRTGQLGIAYAQFKRT